MKVLLVQVFLNRFQVWLPWQRLQSEYLPPSHWRNRLLCGVGCGSVQLRGAGSETLPRTHRLCEVVRNAAARGCCAAGCQRTNTFVPPYSLAIHPDKIRIATGQIAGVDKDGRVSGAWTGEKVIQDSGFFCSLILFKSGR